MFIQILNQKEYDIRPVKSIDRTAIHDIAARVLQDIFVRLPRFSSYQHAHRCDKNTIRLLTKLFQHLMHTRLITKQNFTLLFTLLLLVILVPLVSGCTPSKWLHLELPPFYKTKVFWVMVSILNLIFIIIIFYLLARNKALQKQLKERTGALNKELEERGKTETELKKAKEQAESAYQAKTEFLANISHEIRTPLNAITGFSEMLSSLVSDPKQKSYLEAIKTAGNSLLILINDILDLSRIEANVVTIQPIPVSIKRLFNEITQVFRLKIKKKSILLLFEIDDQLPDSLLLDESRLRQILINLVGNSIKFTEQGFVKLSATIEKKKDHAYQTKIDLIMAVEDSGIGIPEEKQKSIFESFVQLHTDTNKSNVGTGLGLAICRRLVEMMDGQITVTSKVGTGTCFRIHLSNVERGAAAKSFAEKNSPSIIETPDHKNRHTQSVRNLSGLALDLTKTIRPLLLQLKRGMMMSQVRMLGQELVELGKKHQIQTFTNQGEDLIQHAHSFDIANIKRLEKLISKQMDEIFTAVESTDE